MLRSHFAGRTQGEIEPRLRAESTNMAKQPPKSEAQLPRPTDFDPSIDQHRLDYEWLRQAEMYHAAALKQADARREVEYAKQALDVTRADLALEIRKDPSAYGVEKVTEATLEALVTTQPEAKAAAAALHEARHTADMHGAAVASLDHKKRALENLTDLFARDYFAEPQAKTDAAKQAIENKNNESRQGGTEIPDDWN